MSLSLMPPPTMAGFQRLLVTTVQSGRMTFEDVTHIMHAGFHPAAPDDVARAANLVLYRSPIQRQGLLNKFQLEIAGQFNDVVRPLLNAPAPRFHATVDNERFEIRRAMDEGNYVFMARAMMRMAYAVYSLKSQGADRREELEDLIAGYPTPLLRIPATFGINEAGMMHFWDRAEGFWALDDLASDNPNRITFGQARITMFAVAESRTSTRSTMIRDLVPRLEDPQFLRERDPLLRPERHFRPAKGREILLVLGESLGAAFLRGASARLEKMIAAMAPIALRRAYMAEGGVMDAGAPPLTLACRSLLETVDENVASGALSTDRASQIIESIRRDAQPFVDLLVGQRHASPQTFAIRNPYAGQVDFSLKGGGPKGTA